MGILYKELNQMSVFRFKQFSIQHDKSTLKIGTDAVLLGAWTPLIDAVSILDIGTGCGIIALMLAQRTQAKITGIDIDKDSIAEATENGRHSPWSERLQFQYISIQDFIHKNPLLKFDCMVSNPPYFEQSLKSPYQKRNLSKHNDNLSLEELARCVEALLSDKGIFCTILPVNAFQKMKNICQNTGLTPSKICYVKAFSDKAPQRVLACFKREQELYQTDYMYIRELNKSYSTQYRLLTQDFHIMK